MKKYILILLLIIVLGGGFLIYRWQKNTRTKSTSVASPSNSAVALSPSSLPSTNANALAFPIAQFEERITKKPFGIYITPQNSPVQPERFSGFHTGADVEYEDLTGDVPVYAISDGTVVLSRIASGYGGVFVIEIDLNGAKHTVLYGHIRPSSLPRVGQSVKKGEQLAVLGTGNSTETDGERKHLHFAVLSDNRSDIKGYVQSQIELSGWIDPQALF